MLKSLSYSLLILSSVTLCGMELEVQKVEDLKIIQLSDVLNLTLENVGKLKEDLIEVTDKDNAKLLNWRIIQPLTHKKDLGYLHSNKEIQASIQPDKYTITNSSLMEYKFMGVPSVISANAHHLTFHKLLDKLTIFKNIRIRSYALNIIYCSKETTEYFELNEDKESIYTKNQGLINHISRIINFTTTINNNLASVDYLLLYSRK